MSVARCGHFTANATGKKTLGVRAGVTVPRGRFCLRLQHSQRGLASSRDREHGGFRRQLLSVSGNTLMELSFLENC
jgi:hypothetical protein